jgi:hypothetical protein
MGQPGQSEQLPPPIHKNVQKKAVLQYCDSNEFIKLTVGALCVLMSKAAININVNRAKANTTQLKKKSFVTSFANEEITMLQCYVLTYGRSVTAFSAPRSPHPKAGPDCCLVFPPQSYVAFMNSKNCSGFAVSLLLCAPNNFTSELCHI